MKVSITEVCIWRSILVCMWLKWRRQVLHIKNALILLLRTAVPITRYQETHLRLVYLSAMCTSVCVFKWEKKKRLSRTSRFSVCDDALRREWGQPGFCVLEFCVLLRGGWCFGYGVLITWGRGSCQSMVAAGVLVHRSYSWCQ